MDAPAAESALDEGVGRISRKLLVVRLFTAIQLQFHDDDLVLRFHDKITDVSPRLTSINETKLWLG